MDLAEKIILITGGAQGIGAATAQLCAERGATIVIADVVEEAGIATARSITEAGGRAEFRRVDVSHEEQVQALMAGIGERYGRLNGLVAAAGVLKGAFLQPEELPLDVFDQVLSVNVRGTYLCARYGTPLLAETGQGVMILIASAAGVAGPSSSLAYGTSKGGVNGLGMTLANRLASRGIRVNVLCPGEIVTGMKLSVVAAQAEREGRPVDEALERARLEMGSPEGIARVIAFLLSGEADYVRGTLFTR